jgi:hypothetical protein
MNYAPPSVNLRNHKRDKDRKGWSKVYPDDADAARYIANGEIGIAVGQFKTPQMTKPPRKLNIAFSSQPGYQYDFFDWEFSDEGEPPLELAYALTVHKAQGSEFNKVILVLPNPCRLLSRELLYTALTRQLDRVVVLHQGSRYWEHLGMMSDPGYKKRWGAKLKWYRQNRILPHEEGGGSNGTLIITEDNKRQGISSKEIDEVISRTIKK